MALFLLGKFDLKYSILVFSCSRDDNFYGSENPTSFLPDFLQPNFEGFGSVCINENVSFTDKLEVEESII